MAAILLTPPEAEPLSVTDAKAYLRVETGDDDVLIASLIAAARSHVEALSRGVLLTQTWRLVLDGWPPDGRIKPKLAPLNAVTAARVFSVPLPQPRQSVLVIPPALGPVQALALDLPTLASSDPPVLTRLAVFASPWPGSVTVWRSADGLSFERAATVFVPSVIGETLDALPAGPTGCWDRGGEMRVQLYGGALASLADANVLNGANAAAVMNTDGVWEVIQFAQADLVDEKTYRLNRLLRGQAGSEYAIAAPLPAGAPFVLLDEHLIYIARGIGALARATDLRIVATGRSHDDPSALAMTLTPQPTALMPLSPVHLHAARDSSGDIAISWIRRTRKDGDAWGVEVPLGEDSEAYEIDIMSGSSVKRTLSVNAPAATYSSGDESADFGGTQTSLTVRIFQLSSTVGRGHPAQSTLVL